MKLKTKKDTKRKFIIYFLIILILALSSWMFLVESKKIAVFQTKITIQKNLGVNPQEEIVLKFSSKFIKKYYQNKISLFPATDFEEIFEENKIIIRPKNFWPIGEKIRIDLPSGRNFAFLPIAKNNFEFVVSDYPKISYIYPFPGERDVVIGIEDPIEVSFLTSTLGYRITFETIPARELVVESDESKEHFKILPKDGFSPGERVQLKIFASYSDGAEGQSKSIFDGSFTTLPPYPTQWTKDLTQRVAEARKFTQAKIATGKYIDINLDAQVLSIFEDGEIKDSFLISSGKRGMDTPKGEYQIYNKHPRPWSKTYGLYMPFWMAITSSGKFGIHELPEWPGGYKEGANHLGTPVSHGCVRLGVGAAEKVYNWAEIGTKVIIY